MTSDQNGNPEPMRDILARSPVMPIITVSDAADAADLARALVAGGIRAFEVVLRTPDAAKAVAAMVAAAPEAKVGMGTLRSPADVAVAVASGAAFGVSPGVTERLAEAIHHHGLPFLPGVQSASEVMRAAELGFATQKLFPANVVGGLAWLRAMAPVFPEVAFCPTGSIRPPDIPAYLAERNCHAVGGSWMVPPDRIRERDWAAIEALARNAAAFRRPA